jgi:hypothetical protein
LLAQLRQHLGLLRAPLMHEQMCERIARLLLLPLPLRLRL